MQAYVWDSMEDFVDAMEWTTKGVVHISNEFENFTSLHEVFGGQLNKNSSFPEFTQEMASFLIDETRILIKLIMVQ